MKFSKFLNLLMASWIVSGVAQARSLVVPPSAGFTLEEGAPFSIFPLDRDTLAGIIYSEGASMRFDAQTAQVNPLGTIGTLSDLGKTYASIALSVMCRDRAGKTGTGTAPPTVLGDCNTLAGMEKTKCFEAFAATDTAMHAWGASGEEEKTEYCRTRDHFYHECWKFTGTKKVMVLKPKANWTDQLRANGTFTCFPDETRAGSAFGDERARFCRFCVPTVHVK